MWKYKLYLGNSGELTNININKVIKIKWNTERFIFKEYYNIKILKLEQRIAKVILKYKKKSKRIKEYKNALCNVVNYIITG